MHPRNCAPPLIPDLERQLRATNGRWCDDDQLGDQHNCLLAKLEAAPIPSAADALAAMRAVLNELPLFYEDERKLGHPRAALSLG